MLNFDFFNQRAEVRRALSGRLNQTCMDGLRYQDRQATRSQYSEVVWMVPLDGKRPQYSASIPAVSNDLSIQGLSLFHTAPLTDSPLVVGIPGQHGMTFFHCDIKHCTSLGYGFYHIGLFPSKVITPDQTQRQAWERRAAEFAEDSAEQPVEEPVA